MVYVICTCLCAFSWLVSGPSVFLAHKFIEYLSNSIVPIKINILPYGSFYIRYRLFDTKFLVDNIKLFNYPCTIQPFYVTFGRGIDRLSFTGAFGSGVINGLNVFNLQSKPISISLNNISLNYFNVPEVVKNTKINLDCIVQIKKNGFDAQLRKLQLLNTPIGEIQASGNYTEETLRCRTILKKWNHAIIISGGATVGEGPSWDLKFAPSSSIRVRDLKIARTNLSFTLDYDFRWFGKSNRHGLQGFIDINHGKLQTPNHLDLLKSFEGKIKLQDSNITLDSFTASVDSFWPGLIKASGKLDINSMNMKMNINMPDARLKNVPFVKGSLGANFHVSGKIPALLATGRIDLNHAQVDLSPVINSSMLATGMVKKFLNAKNKQTHLNSLMPLATDITFHLTPNANIIGPGLQSVWTGQGRAKCKKGEKFHWDASMALISGQYKVANKRLKLTSGYLISNPNIPGYYQISLTGSKKKSGKLFGIKFFQKLQDTQLQFFSTPMMSKQDILAHLLFDKSSAEMSASEAYSLGLLLQNLTANKGGILSKLNDMLKIDTIEIKKNNPGQADEYNSVRIGKKIGKWYINIDQGRSTDSTQLAVERKIAKNLKVKIGTSAKNSLGAGISWSKRY